MTIKKLFFCFILIFSVHIKILPMDLNTDTSGVQRQICELSIDQPEVDIEEEFEQPIDCNSTVEDLDEFNIFLFVENLSENTPFEELGRCINFLCRPEFSKLFRDTFIEICLRKLNENNVDILLDTVRSGGIEFKNGGRMLDLSYMLITSRQLIFLMPLISEIENLYGLKLKGNHLTKIDGIFSDLSRLRGLDLKDNRISNIGEAFSGLNELRWIRLASNNIENLNGCFLNLRGLKTIGLYNNRISNIIGQFNSLKKLEVLDLGKNQIDGIAGAFEGLSNLRTLSLFENKIFDITMAFNNLPNLEKLLLRRNNALCPEHKIYIDGLENVQIFINNNC